MIKANPQEKCAICNNIIRLKRIGSSFFSGSVTTNGRICSRCLNSEKKYGIVRDKKYKGDEYQQKIIELNKKLIDKVSKTKKEAKEEYKKLLEMPPKEFIKTMIERGLENADF